jgi:hypothetical protein
MKVLHERVMERGLRVLTGQQLVELKAAHRDAV